MATPKTSDRERREQIRKRLKNRMWASNVNCGAPGEDDGVLVGDVMRWLDQLEAAERDRERLRELRRMISHHLYTPQDIDRIRDAAKEKAK